MTYCKAENREKSSRHVTMVAKFLDPNKPWSCKYGRKKLYDFPVHDCTQEQNGSPYFSSIVGQCWMAVSVKKGCRDPEMLPPR